MVAQGWSQPAGLTRLANVIVRRPWQAEVLVGVQGGWKLAYHCLQCALQVAWRCWSALQFGASQGWNAMLGLLAPVLFDP